MLNEHDIKDMQPERKFEGGLPHADNHEGWVVMRWTLREGYVKVSGVYEVRGNAESVCAIYNRSYPNEEYSVHEALKAK